MWREKVSGTFCAEHPKGRSGKRFLTPFLSGRNQQGTALIVVLSLVMVASGLLAAMMTLHNIRSTSALEADRRLARLYAAEAGMERAQLEVQNDWNWLVNNKDKTAAVFTGGASSFNLGDFKVSVTVSSADTTWYLVQSSAVNVSGDAKHKRTTTIAMTAKGGTVFSDYARFVSQQDLSVGANASYGGKVHTNGNLGINGDYITFFGTATAHLSITYGSSSNKKTCVFKKSATPGMPSLTLPDASQLEAISHTAPAGAVMYDWNDTTFKNAFKTATGYTPTSDLAVSITLNKDKMNVVSTSKCGGSFTRTFTQSGIAVPHDGSIFSRGPVTVAGNISRRMSILTPTTITVNGPLRYVDDSGGTQWELRKKTDNSLAAFDATMNSWSPTTDWDNSYNYVESTTWDSRAPVVNAEKVDPALGLVAGSTITLAGSQVNREIMAALFTSGDVIRTSASGRTNLYIHGSIITTATNPLSGYFAYRVYAYDPHLRSNPPPGFPGGDAASFRNWQVVDLEKH